jgi:hypothetical protein
LILPSIIYLLFLAILKFHERVLTEDLRGIKMLTELQTETKHPTCKDGGFLQHRDKNNEENRKLSLFFVRSLDIHVILPTTIFVKSQNFSMSHEPVLSQMLHAIQ